MVAERPLSARFPMQLSRVEGSPGHAHKANRCVVGRRRAFGALGQDMAMCWLRIR